MLLVYLFLGFVITFVLLNIIFGNKENYGITFIAGEIGSGKTCYATKIARFYIKKGWNVYTNYNCNGCFKLEPERLVDECYPVKSVLILDEASLEHNSRKFSTISMGLLEYYKLSRHFKNKVFLISQTFTDTDKQIRDLSDKVLFVRKIIHGCISMPVNVKGKLDIDDKGQPTIKYKVGKLGAPYYLRKWFKYFNSFDKPNRAIAPSLKW